MQLQEKIKSSRNINPQIWLLRTLFSISREAKNFAKQGQWGSGGGVEFDFVRFGGDVDTGLTTPQGFKADHTHIRRARRAVLAGGD